MKYEVVVYCEGAWSFDVEAENESRAMDVAREKFYDLPVEEVASGVDVIDYDVYAHVRQVPIR